MARMSSATSTKKADPTGPLRRSRPNRTPGGRRRAGMLSRRLYDGVGESLDHRGARTLLVVKPESPRELSSALTGRLEISTATTIRHSQPAELDLVEQGGRFSPRGPTRPLTLWTTPQLSPRPAVVASVTVVSGFRDAFPASASTRHLKRQKSVKKARHDTIHELADFRALAREGDVQRSLLVRIT